MEAAHVHQGILVHESVGPPLMISNWTKWHSPFEPMENFTRHEPFPSNEVKATYVDGLRKRRKRDSTLGSRALEALQKSRKGKNGYRA